VFCDVRNGVRSVIDTGHFCGQTELLEQMDRVAVSTEPPFELLPEFKLMPDVVEAYAKAKSRVFEPIELGVFFKLSDNKIEFFRESNKPNGAHRAFGLDMDCDGWGHAWLFVDKNTPCWHLQFSTQFDRNVEDALMNNLVELEGVETTSSITHHVIEFGKYPFGELPYRFDELPEKVQRLSRNRDFQNAVSAPAMM